MFTNVPPIDLDQLAYTGQPAVKARATAEPHFVVSIWYL